MSRSNQFNMMNRDKVSVSSFVGGNSDDWQNKMKLLIRDDSIPLRCEVCNAKVKYIGLGKYECNSCQHEMFDNYGKARIALEKRPLKMDELMKQAGLSRSQIQKMISNGSLVFSGDGLRLGR